jgi:hypothetical protein
VTSENVGFHRDTPGTQPHTTSYKEIRTKNKRTTNEAQKAKEQKKKEKGLIISANESYEYPFPIALIQIRINTLNFCLSANHIVSSVNSNYNNQT